MIQVKSIYKSFDNSDILKEIDTAFNRGQTNLIIGQSGSGKTVLLKCLLGLYDVDSGEIIYDGISSKNMNHDDKLEISRKMGIDIAPNDYVFQVPSNRLKPYSRQQFYLRLQRVLKASGLEAELADEGKKLSLYSSRHFFITMRLRYGKVPLYLLSKVVGSSVSNLTDVYGHIDTEIEAATITRNMGALAKSGFEMKPVAADEE